MTNLSEAVRVFLRKLAPFLREERTVTLGAPRLFHDGGWGSQIRSYVLDQSRIKDLRTNVESGNISSILDGDIDIFIKASLTQGV